MRIEITCCDWCGRKVRGAASYETGWRSLAWLKSDHMCPDCVEAAKAAMRCARDARAGSSSPEDPVAWVESTERGGDPQ